MTRIILCLSLLFIITQANAGMVINFNEKKINQGSLQDVNLIIDEESFTKLDSIKLLGLTINETLYIQSISPFKKENSNQFSANATVIFLKIPKESSNVFETPKGKIEIAWGNIQLTPTEAPQGFLFGSFEIPSPKNILLVLISLIAIGALSFAGWKLKKKRDKKRKAQKILENLKKQIRNSGDYESIVETWKRKHEIISCFPNLTTPFAVLEKELFKVQFKPAQSDLEKELVKKAYDIFLEQIKGDLDGV